MSPGTPSTKIDEVCGHLVSYVGNLYARSNLLFSEIKRELISHNLFKSLSNADIDKSSNKVTIILSQSVLCSSISTLLIFPHPVPTVCGILVDGN